MVVVREGEAGGQGKKVSNRLSRADLGKEQQDKKGR